MEKRSAQKAARMVGRAISEVQVDLFRVPLREVMADAKHGNHTHFELVTVTAVLESGARGTGYTYTGGKGGHAIRAMIRHDLAPVLVGQEAGEVEAAALPVRPGHGRRQR